jgi:hypothetical protein
MKNKDVLLEKIWELVYLIEQDDYIKIFSQLEEIRIFINNNF